MGFGRGGIYVRWIRELTPSQKGAIAEAAVTAAAVELGLTVLRPLCEGRRYDLVIDLEPRLLRVQCKLARCSDGRIEVRLGTNRLTPAGYVHSTYTSYEIDAVAVYCANTRECYLIPAATAARRRALNLRTEPARNGQRRGVRWASDFQFADGIAGLRSEAWGQAVRL